MRIKFIFVNGIEKAIGFACLYYSDIVFLAGMSGFPSITYSDYNHTFTKILSIDQKIETIEGMKFNVSHTGNA